MFFQYSNFSEQGHIEAVEMHTCVCINKFRLEKSMKCFLLLKINDFSYQVLKFLPQSKTDLEFLKDIRRSFNDGQIDVWRMPARVGEAAHLLVGPEAKVNVLRRQLKSSIISTQIDDLERLVRFSI